MFLPIGDEPKATRTARVTHALIAANVLVYILYSLPGSTVAADAADPLLQDYLAVMSQQLRVAPQQLAGSVSAYDLFIFRHGFRPAAWSWQSLFSSMFVHSGFAHLFGNMLFLKIFGENVETRLRGLPFLLVYFATGALGTLLFALFQLHSQVPLVGASGALSGVLGCYFICFPQNRVKLLMTFFLSWDVIRVPARIVLGFYIVVENVLPLLLQSGGNVAYGAHLGGFLAGALFARARALGPNFAAALADDTPGEPTFVGIVEDAPLRKLVRDHDFSAAFAVYQGLRTTQYAAAQDDDLLLLADWLMEQRRFDDALALLQKFIAVRPSLPGDFEGRRQALAQTHLRAGHLQERVFNRPQVAVQHYQSVLSLQPHWRLAQAARQGLAALIPVSGNANDLPS